MSHSKRTGFTLVELLVVITIIGMLMAILLPAIGAATENARSLQCKNRLKQTATAMASYESRFNSYPGYVNGVDVETNSSSDHREVPMPWLVAIMGDLERNDILDQWKQGNLTAPYLDFFTCPSDPPLEPGKPSTSYVANAGNAKADLAGCGMLHTRYPLHDTNNHERKLSHTISSFDKLAAGDGGSKTLMLTENVQASTWDAPSYLGTQRPKPNMAGVKKGLPHNVFIWHDTTTPDEAWRVNGGNFPPGIDPSPDNARPSSEHRNGVNAAFADAHVVFLSKDIDYTVYARLMSTDSKKCFKEFKINFNQNPKIDHTVPLSDSDY